MQFSPEVQRRLFYIRSIGFDVFHNAEERIYHRVPTLKFNGKDVLNYGAYKDHITLWLGYPMIDYLKNEYPQYNYTKTTIQFTHLDCFPNELIREIFENVARMMMNKNIRLPINLGSLIVVFNIYG
jgi:uncharacterized protein YdhG (YjbR/CyaY superfamily)